jgi:hypothetical protein
MIALLLYDEAVATDAAETAAFGERRGDELPEVVATTHGRHGWLRAARQRLDQERAQRADPIPRSRPERPLEAKRRLEEDLATERQANASYGAARRAPRAAGRSREARRWRRGRGRPRPRARAPRR